MNPIEQAIEAFEAMMKGSQFVTINGDADWHTIQMPNRDALNKAAAALAALKAYQQAARDVELPEAFDVHYVRENGKIVSQVNLYDEDSVRAAITAHQARQAVPEEPSRPDILERLRYHALERDDLSLNDCLAYLAKGWATVHGRTERQMVMQILALLAAAPTPEATQPTQAACIACGKASGHESWCARQRWGIGQTTQAEAAPEQVERGLAAIKACQAMAADGWLSFGAEGMSAAQKEVLDVLDAAREAKKGDA